jgi:hypothetical protein
MTTAPLALSNPRTSVARLTVATVGGLLAALLMALIPTATAHAAYYAAPSGRIGSVTVNGPMINAYDVGRWLPNGTYFYSKNWGVGGFTVTRSPSSYSQRVTGVSTIQRWDGRWVDIQSRSWTGTVSGAGTLSFPTWTWSPTNVPNNRASYRVNFVITWTDYSSGQLLALTAILPNSYADNRCSTKHFRCTSYTDGLNF